MVVVVVVVRDHVTPCSLSDRGRRAFQAGRRPALSSCDGSPGGMDRRDDCVHVVAWALCIWAWFGGFWGSTPQREIDVRNESFAGLLPSGIVRLGQIGERVQVCEDFRGST